MTIPIIKLQRQTLNLGERLREKSLKHEGIKLEQMPTIFSKPPKKQIVTQRSGHPMLSKSHFHDVLVSAQWKIAHSGAISPEKLNVYWEEFKDVSLTDEQFAGCLAAVSKRSTFFPKVAEIWEEIDRIKSKLPALMFNSIGIARGIAKPEWFDEMVEQEKAGQQKRQDKLNGGKYVGSPAYDSDASPDQRSVVGLRCQPPN